MGLHLDTVNVLAELENYGIKYEFAGSNEVRICCPFHKDGKEKTPSCHVNTQNKLFKCQTAGCEAHGDIVKLLAKHQTNTVGLTGQDAILIDLATRYEIDSSKIIDATTVERWHSQIWSAGVLLNELYNRGITDNIIRRYRLGVDSGRITIPIYGPTGLYVNVRKYLPGAPGPQKMRNTKGHSEGRWYPYEQLSYETIVLFGGECKALVAASQLNPHSIGAVTFTHGEGKIPPEDLKVFKNKRVIICMDVDAAGVAAAKKIANYVRMVATWVGVLDLPLDKDKYPKGDVNDFIAKENGDIYSLIAGVSQFQTILTDPLAADESEPVDKTLNEAIVAENEKIRLRFKSQVVALDTNPYLIPKDIEIECLKDEDFCGECPVFVNNRSKFTIPPECPALLEFINVSKSTHIETVKAAIGIPARCKSCAFEALANYNVEDTRIAPPLDVANRAGDRQPVAAICVGAGLQPNGKYEMVGRLVPHPRTQQATLLISKYAASQTDLQNFVLENPEQLGWFYPREFSVEAIEEKLKDIYDDLSYNVTQIFQRHDMHLITDLTYHSALSFNFNGKLIKGCVESIIMGDSGQGKSEVVQFLQNHYGLGARFESKNASVAGILGGMEQMGDRWFVSWGIIPNNDQGLVWLEELKGMPLEVFGKFTDMRSSQVAEITKIGKQWRHQARTRLIATSNPRSNLTIAQYSYGVMALVELVGAPEDLRRFDVCMVCEKSEVDKNVINIKQEDRTYVEHKYTHDLCKNLILWGWTRKDDQIEFTPEATTATLEAANRICSQFSDTIPIVDHGSMRHKIARLATAVAIRTFSHKEDDYDIVEVYPCHVEFILKFLLRIYSTQAFGYTLFTEKQKVLSSLLSADEIKAAICKVPFPRALVDNLLQRDFIEEQDLADWTTYDRSETQALKSLLVRKYALIRKNKAYCKSPKFIEFLKQLLLSGDLPPDTDPMNMERF